MLNYFKFDIRIILLRLTFRTLLRTILKYQEIAQDEIALGSHCLEVKETSQGMRIDY